MSFENLTSVLDKVFMGPEVGVIKSRASCHRIILMVRTENHQNMSLLSAVRLTPGTLVELHLKDALIGDIASLGVLLDLRAVYSESI